ncbi:MAG TPA: hypothetical protein VH165_09765 [Kofleriaceae bacterium]|jgi:hypothetical protein|nr:hypothetical protein [Kofleriaceae bacterium]
MAAEILGVSADHPTIASGGDVVFTIHYVSTAVGKIEFIPPSGFTVTNDHVNVAPAMDPLHPATATLPTAVARTNASGPTTCHIVFTLGDSTWPYHLGVR